MTYFTQPTHSRFQFDTARLPGPSTNAPDRKGSLYLLQYALKNSKERHPLPDSIKLGRETLLLDHVMFLQETKLCVTKNKETDSVNNKTSAILLINAFRYKQVHDLEFFFPSTWRKTCFRWKIRVEPEVGINVSTYKFLAKKRLCVRNYIISALIHKRVLNHTTF